METKTENIKLGGLFYPTVDQNGKEIPFDNLYIPYIYKEIYFEGVYIDVLNGRSDMTIVDVGANIGVVTQYMRPYAKKIYALEPSSEHFTALKQNKDYNNWDNVEVFNVALSDKDGEASLSWNSANRTCNSITNGYGEGTEMVKTVAMDTFFEQNGIEQCDFMKFDVEGADELILYSEGFKKVADKIKAIEIEFHHHTWPEIVKYLQDLGFTARRYEASAIIVLFTR